MARKHHSKKTTKRRSHRRGLGAVNVGSATSKVLGIAAGAVASRMLGNAVGSKISPLYLSLGKIAIGAFIVPKMAKGSAILNGAADGIVAEGTISLLVDRGVIKGIDDMTDGMSSVGDLSEIGSYDTGFAGTGNDFETIEP